MSLIITFHCELLVKPTMYLALVSSLEDNKLREMTSKHLSFERCYDYGSLLCIQKEKLYD